MSSRPRTTRIALGFATGILLPIVGLFVLTPVLGAAGVFTGGSVVRVIAVLGASAILGGAVAGGALGRAWRGRLAFAVAFPIGVCVPLFAVLALQALSGRESLLQLSVGLVGSFAFSFALLGAIGAALLGCGWRLTAKSALAFASSGALGGVMLVAVAVLPTRTSADATWFGLIGSAAALLVSAAVGGWWFAWLSVSGRAAR